MIMRCGACGGEMAAIYRTRDYNRGASDEIFRYEKCVRCGVISLANVPADLGRFYAAGYHEIPASIADLERGAEHDRYKIELTTRFVQRGRLLEIGPSWGAFCLLAKRAGFAVEAVELDPRCCQFLESKLGVRAMQSADPAAAIKSAGPYDVIALWHVVEHVENPWRLLRATAQRLAPGGVLIVATPNPEAFQMRVFGRFWTHIDAPRHVHLLPREQLRRQMQKEGLNLQLLTTRDAGSVGWDDFGWRFSTANLTPVGALRRPFRLAGRLLGKLAAPLERGEGRGSAYTAVFRKPAAH